MKSDMTYIIYDNDMGNDIDDAFAQVMAARAHVHGKASLALCLSSNPNPNSLLAIKGLNEYYGASGIPLGIHRGTLKYSNDSNGMAAVMGAEVKPEEINAEDGVAALRRVLNGLPDKSARIVATGFATNLAGLMKSGKDHCGDGIMETGLELAKRKVQFLSIMAGDFHSLHKEETGEFNVDGDIPAMRLLMDSWPTEIVVSDFLVGLKTVIDWPRLDRQLSDANPLKRGYRRFYQKEDGVGEIGARPSWDQTSMLYALEPDGDHFALSEEGSLEIKSNGVSVFHPGAGGRRRHLIYDATHTAEKVNEALHSRYYLEPGA